MKKVLVVLLAVCMLLSTAGCGSTPQKSGDGNVPTLTWLVPGNKQSDTSVVLEEANKIIEEKIGAKLDLQFIDASAFSERMTMNMASGGKFDLCFTGYVNNYRQAVQKGGLLQLDKYLENMPELMAVLPDYVWKAARVNDGIYAVPNQQIMAYQLTAYTFADLAEKYGLKAENVKNARDLEPYLEQIKQNEPSYYPIRSNWGTSMLPGEQTREDIVSGIFAVFGEDGSVKTEIKYETESEIEAAKMLHEWFQKGYIRSDIASVMSDTSDYDMGKYAVWTAQYKPGADATYEKKFGRPVVAVPITPNLLESKAGLDTMIGVSKQSKYPEKAVQLIELVNTDKELYNLICFGIEGKHYTKTGENRIEQISGSNYAPDASWKFGSEFNAYLQPGQDDDVWEQTKSFNDAGKESLLLGFAPNTDPIVNEIAQCEAIIGEYKVWNNGAEDPMNYQAELVERLKSAGIEKVRDELQKQIDEWLAKQ